MRGRLPERTGPAPEDPQGTGKRRRLHLDADRAGPDEKAAQLGVPVHHPEPPDNRQQAPDIVRAGGVLPGGWRRRHLRLDKQRQEPAPRPLRALHRRGHGDGARSQGLRRSDRHAEEEPGQGNGTGEVRHQAPDNRDVPADIHPARVIVQGRSRQVLQPCAGHRQDGHPRRRRHGRERHAANHFSGVPARSRARYVPPMLLPHPQAGVLQRPQWRYALAADRLGGHHRPHNQGRRADIVPHHSPQGRRPVERGDPPQDTRGVRRRPQRAVLLHPLAQAHPQDDRHPSQEGLHHMVLHKRGVRHLEDVRVMRRDQVGAPHVLLAQLERGHVLLYLQGLPHCAGQGI